METSGWVEKAKRYWWVILALFLAWWYLRARASASPATDNSSIYPIPLDYGSMQQAAQSALDAAAAFPGIPTISIPGTSTTVNCDPCHGMQTGGLFNLPYTFNPATGFCEAVGTSQKQAPSCCPQNTGQNSQGACLPNSVGSGGTTIGGGGTPPTSGVGNGNNPVGNPPPPTIHLCPGGYTWSDSAGACVSNSSPAPTPAPPPPAPAPSPPPGGGVGGPIFPGGPNGPPATGGGGSCSIPGETRDSSGICQCLLPKTLKFTGRGWLCS